MAACSTRSYLDPKSNLSPRSQAPVYVKPNYYFVMGDNRDNSSDSRAWGLVPKKYVYGKALLRYWPLERGERDPPRRHLAPVPPPSGLSTRTAGNAELLRSRMLPNGSENLI